MTEWTAVVGPRFVGFLAGSAAFLALAAVMARAHPRRRPNLALAAYCLMLGAALAFAASRDILPGLPDEGVRRAVALSFEIATSVLLFVFASLLPRPNAGPRPFERPVAAAAAISLCVMGVAAIVGSRSTQWEPRFGGPVLKVAFVLDLALFLGAAAFLLSLLAMRFVFARPGTGGDRPQAALLGVAVCILPASYAGPGLAYREDAAMGLRLVALGVLIAGAAAWLAIAHRMTASDARLARNVAWAFLLAPLASACASIAFGDSGSHVGFSQLLSAFVLTYAILRHQLLGLDVKVRFAISKSTIAAVFIAVFFVASEAAQQFFGERSGSQYLGIVAAGALVFAIAPLSRLAERVAYQLVPTSEAQGGAERRPSADRFAERAVPATTGSREREAGSGPMAPAYGLRPSEGSQRGPGREGALGPTAYEERTRLFALTARKYLADGRLDDEEEIALARLADELGLGAGDAMTIRKAVERKRGSRR
ncbi:MAG: hypothetical protein ACT4PT_10430 [Methanobacteriota archaeon]